MNGKLIFPVGAVLTDTNIFLTLISIVSNC